MNTNNIGAGIAIVVPVYNAGKKLHQCIRSILGQNYRNFALILVNDGSTDKSGNICDTYAKKDSRVHVIHKENGGSVEARKTGVFSDIAQSAKYITFCDADDVLPQNVLKKFFDTAEYYTADLICGKVGRIWKGFRIPETYASPCLKFDNLEAETAKVYFHDDIIKKLYISCFGISDFPVSLCAKLYRTELITKASQGKAVVHFMGEDLSVTLKVMPNAEKLVIIPDVVYQYRIGGGTSKFRPDTLADFLALYTYKKQFVNKYVMPQDAKYLMNVELMNILQNWFVSCSRDGGYEEKQLMQEIYNVCNMPLVQGAVTYLYNKQYELGEQIHPLAEAIFKAKYSIIKEIVLNQVKKTKWKILFKRLLLQL